MKPDGIDELKELIAFLRENEIAEFDLDRGDLKVRLKFASAVVQAAPAASSGMDMVALARLLSVGGGATLQPAAGTVALPAAAAAIGGPVAESAAAEEVLHILKSPIVGTFYESPSPGSSAFVSTGDRIDKGQVVCIVEAMKLMNEIEADMSGEIVKRLVTNGQAVEYGQPLFAIRVA